MSRDLLLTSSYLSSSGFTGNRMKELVTRYLNATDNRWCSWSVSTQWWGRGGPYSEGKGCWETGQRGLWGSPVRPSLQLSQAGLLASVVPAHLLRLYHLLLFTLPGTPVFSSGDEIGLKAAALPGQVSGAASPARVLWVWADGRESGGGTALDAYSFT